MRFVDPVTGDQLGPSEKFSRLVQSVIRRWLFVLGYVVFFTCWWAFQWFHDKQHTYLNLTLSIMALVIESAVGIGVFNQTLRDAVILRKLLRIEEHIEKLLEKREHQGS